MQVTINKDKVELLETLLDQEIIQLRVEIHHTHLAFRVQRDAQRA